MRRGKCPKVKYKHHVIQGLKEFLEGIKTIPCIKRVFPGRMYHNDGRPKPFKIKVTQDTMSGIKCIAQSGQMIQEVFIVTPDKDETKKLMFF